MTERGVPDLPVSEDAARWQPDPPARPSSMTPSEFEEWLIGIISEVRAVRRGWMCFCSECRRPGWTCDGCGKSGAWTDSDGRSIFCPDCWKAVGG